MGDEFAAAAAAAAEFMAAQRDIEPQFAAILGANLWNLYVDAEDEVSVTQTLDGLEVVLNDSERQPVECFTRVMGYHRPVSFFNVGKKREFEDRLPFNTCKTERILLRPSRTGDTDPDGGPRIACLPAATGETTGYTAGTA